MVASESSQKNTLSSFASCADGMAARILILPLHLPLDADGWTQQSYSVRQLMTSANMSYSTGQAEKFSNYLAMLIALGLLESRSAGEEKFFYRFLYAKNFSTEREEIQTTPEKILPMRDRDSKDSKKSEEDLNPESNSVNKKSSSESLSPEKKSLLKKHNVLTCYHAFAAEWDLEPLQQLVLNAEKGKEIGIVKSVGGYIATCLAQNEVNVPPDNYIQAAEKLEVERREKEAAEQRQREEQEAWERLQAEREAELERRRAERAARPKRVFSGLPEEVIRPNMTERDIWLAVLGELQIQLHPAIYRTWVSGARLMGFDGYKAHISVENDYIRDWLQQRLVTTFERSLSRIVRGKEKITPVFEVEEREDELVPMYAAAGD